MIFKKRAFLTVSLSLLLVSVYDAAHHFLAANCRITNEFCGDSFKAISLDNSQIAWQDDQNGQYLRAGLGSNSRLGGVSSQIQAWETFNLIPLVPVGERTKGQVGSHTTFTLAQQRELIETHNQYRLQVGVSPLSWSNPLARSAKQWAAVIANRHRDGSWITAADHGSAGENIWQGSRGGFSLTAMVEAWGSEKQYFRNGVFDARNTGSAISTTGQWSDVGHYTQIVWKNTQEVGCGLAKTSQHEFLVCRYNPPGNILGQRVY